MKVKPLQIHWHDKQPIYSAHFEPGPKGRLATAGGDCNIRIWKIDRNREKDSAHVDFLSSLNRHSAAVNVVRFSPTSECLASAGDDGNIILWKPTESKEAVSRFAESDDDEFERETWRVQSVMRGSLSDIYDLAWSPDGKFIISGSIDNTARIWDIGTSKCLHVIADHHHYVQGVAWDPLGEFVATQSSDRSVHVYSFKADKNGQVLVNLVGKSTKLDFSKFRSPPQPAMLVTKTPVSTASTDDTEMNADSTTTDDAVKPVRAAPKSFKTYHDETLTSFFRRLSFTPDGAMLLVPAGQYKTPSIKPVAQAADDTNPAPQLQDTETRNTSYIYARRDFARGPVAHLPGHKKPSVAIKCSPILYELRKELLPPSQHSVYNKRPSATTSSTTPAANQETVKPPSVFGLAYRSVYAVATQDSILIYDTQQTAPLALVSHLHYATYTDMAWSGDGCNLIVASSDGFCSLISFEEGELGTVYKPPRSMADLMGSAENNMVVTANENLDPAATIAATAGMMQKLNGLSLTDIKELKDPKEIKETKEPKGKAKGDKSLVGTEGKKALVKKLFSKASSKAAKSSLKTERDGDTIMTSAEHQPSPKKRKIQPTFVSPLPGSLAKSPSVQPPTTPTTPTTPAVTMEPAVAWNSSPSSAVSSSPPTSGSASPAAPAAPDTPKPKKRIQPTFVSALPGH